MHSVLRFLHSINHVKRKSKQTDFQAGNKRAGIIQVSLSILDVSLTRVYDLLTAAYIFLFNNQEYVTQRRQQTHNARR